MTRPVTTLRLTSKQKDSELFATVSILTKEHFPEFEQLQHKVVAEVGEAQFSPVPMPYLNRRIDEQGSIGVFVEGKLQAVLVDFLHEDILPLFEDKIGIELKLSQGLRQYLYIVAPELRGYSITKQLLAIALQLEKARGTTHVLATVQPNNTPSLKSLIDSGFAIRFVGPLYGEHVRFITYANLQKQFVPQAATTHWLSPLEIAAQQQLLAQGNIGVRLKAERGEVLVGYEKRAFVE